MDDRSPTAILIPPDVATVSDVDRARIDAYWIAVGETLRAVYGETDGASIVATARERLGQASIETQNIFYHASPYQVASDLVGVAETGLSERQLSAYRDIITNFDPSLYAPTP